ncbi:uncharacterized protein [Miscanthus floridulus]|uniref:uncharacterized protein n=1 Tax=Miscanthus floridulus TaxID=154761 RepID=UPI00345B1DFB
MVEAKLRGGNLTPITMRPSWGFLLLGMRDVRSSPLPVPEDTRRWAINRAHADAQKKRKDAKVTKHMKQLLAHEELDKRHRQQRKEGLPLEESPSTSPSTEALDGDDGGEIGRGPLDHLLDVVEVAPRASASSPALPGRGGEADPGSAVAGSEAEADTPEAGVLGKRAISPLGSAAMVEQAAVEVAEAQAAIQRGAVSTRVNPKELAAQGGAADDEVTPTQTREGAPPPHGGEAHESDGASMPLVAEAPEVSEAEATEDRARKTAETAVAAVVVSTSSEAMMAEVGALEGTDATVMAARPSSQEAEMKAGEASAAPLV